MILLNGLREMTPNQRRLMVLGISLQCWIPLPVGSEEQKKGKKLCFMP